MLYKHFIAALAVAFLCFIGTIAAQTKIDTLPEKEFLKLLETDDKQAFALAQGKKLTVEQLAFFARHQLAHQRNPQYVSALYHLYWEQLSPVERMDYEYLRFFQEFYYVPVDFDNQYKNDSVFKHVMDNQNEYKTAWGEALYSKYICNQLTNICKIWEAKNDTNNKPSITEKEKQAEACLVKIKQHFPLYEPQVRAQLYFLCVYDAHRQPEKHYFWFNKYALNHLNDPDKLYHASKQLILYGKEKKFCKYGLKWVEKAIKIKPHYTHYILKAHLLLRTGKKRQAIRLLNSPKIQLDSEDFLTMIYLQRLWQEIAKKE